MIVGNVILLLKGYVFIVNFVDVFFYVWELKFVEFCIFYLFVYVVFYGGFVLELFDDNCFF